MKLFSLLFILFMTISISGLNAQSGDHEKLENLKYYLTSLKDNAQSMRYYTDSVKVLSLLDQIDVLAANIETEVNKVVLPAIEESQTVIETTEVEEINGPEVTDPNMGTTEDYSDNSVEDGGLGISKYMPFKKKFNTKLNIEFGINSLLSGDKVANVLYPEINTGGSWYWDFGLVRSARLGGKESKVAFNYGLSFLKNRFKFENDVRLISNTNTQPEFIAIENVKCSPKLNVGYLNLPLSFTFAFTKKFNVELGGYVGYRIHTVQKVQLKEGKESIEEQRYASYQLNNWVYGGKVSIDISGFNLIGRYNFSKLFKDNPNFDYNTFMVGTSFSLF